MPVSESYSAGDELPAADVVALAKATNRAFFAGEIRDFFGIEASVPTGWLICAGGTIGDGSSGASLRANADMQTLFNILWDVGHTYATLSIYDSGGSGSTYGASAAADWAAHKRIALPDFRGRVSAGRDDLGGSDGGHLSSATGNKVGGALGAETVDISHNHTWDGSTRSSDSGGAGHGSYSTTSSAVPTTGMSANNTPSVLQPMMMTTKIIATGVTW